MPRSHKRKTSLGRVLLTVIFTALFVVLAIFGIKYLMDNVLDGSLTSDKEEEKTETSENVSTGDVSISVVDYVVYKDTAGDLDFNFVIADLKFTTNSGSLYYDFNNLVTSDGKIELGQTDYYYAQLNKFEYNLSGADLTKYYVKSDSDSAEVNILIPYSNVSGELKVYYDTNVLKFDLTSPESAETFVKSNPTTGNTITDETTGKDIFVTASYVSDYMERLNNGQYEAFDVGTNQAYFTFEIMVNEINDNVKITEAYFIADGSSKAIAAADSSYRAMEIDNIIGKTLKKGDDYALFFPVNKMSDTSLNLDGVLRIKFSDSDKYVEIETSLN